ncbi:putative N-acetyltransferase-like protein [Hapsidospora chrysogenum ATCC 11550]|uniref:Putative N-acetyltransferase-like protein n=1 Tax=Hapsidospora chrysogenum (strain ATCC 11550 / CBS 779.69 / DSM 880 / IAM 14645 / JCM 23072 / IMI 49137) TaxID=857340 RepID=A0A086TDU7_HAPC1|nr:putative N-acetyltransferase-like protein [Hapsidospora chrysogenum ATCC 11550]
MTISTEPWASQATTTNHQLLHLPLPILAALADGDLPSAQDHIPTTTTTTTTTTIQLTPYLIGPECRHVWHMRGTQIKADPLEAPWVARLVLADSTVVGRAGFHGQPDDDGVVEIGYAIDPLHRRRGHASAAVRIMLDVARGLQRVKVVRAAVGVGNYASRKLLDQSGFRKVGEQWDEVDGLEDVLELSVA